MSPVTVDGVPFGESRQFGDDGPTMDEVNNLALAPVSRELGWCLCIRPFMTMIDFTGLTCGWCGQPVTKDVVSSAEAKTLRARAILAIFPALRRQE